MKCDSICRTTLVCYTSNLIIVVVKKCAALLPRSVCIDFDGWSSGDTQKVSLCAAFPAINGEGYDRIQLAMPLKGKKDLQRSDAHFKFIFFVVAEVTERLMQNVAAIAGDNPNTSLALSQKFFVGRHSHRFNLAIQISSTIT